MSLCLLSSSSEIMMVSKCFLTISAAGLVVLAENWNTCDVFMVASNSNDFVETRNC